MRYSQVSGSSFIIWVLECFATMASQAQSIMSEVREKNEHEHIFLFFFKRNQMKREDLVRLNLSKPTKLLHHLRDYNSGHLDQGTN